MADIVYRLARPDDAGATIALQAEVFPSDPNNLTEADFSASPPEGLTIILADSGSQIVGYCVLRDRPRRPWTGVDLVGVTAAMRGRGIAQDLVKRAIGLAGRPLMRLFVARGNVDARAVYGKLGFYHVSTKAAHYPDGDDALVMMCPSMLKRGLPLS